MAMYIRVVTNRGRGDYFRIDFVQFLKFLPLCLSLLTRHQPLTLAPDLQPPTNGESLNLDDGGPGK